MQGKTDWTALGFIVACVLFTVYGQVAIKHQVSKMPPLPADLGAKAKHLFLAFSDPLILSALASAFVAVAFWIMALSRGLELTYAYPFTSLSFLLVLGASAIFFGEALTLQKLLGVALIMIGIAVSTQSAN